MLASTILPSGAMSNTGFGSALRMASPSDGGAWRCSAAEVMQQRSMQSRQMHHAENDARHWGPRRSKSFAARILEAPPAHSWLSPPRPAPSRDVFGHGEAR